MRFLGRPKLHDPASVWASMFRVVVPCCILSTAWLYPSSVVFVQGQGGDDGPSFNDGDAAAVCAEANAGPSWCGQPGSCGNCLEVRDDATGCDCPGCECLVCATDFFCCSEIYLNRWDSLCVRWAEELCNCTDSDDNSDDDDDDEEEDTSSPSVDSFFSDAPSDLPSDVPSEVPSLLDDEDTTMAPSESSDFPSSAPTVDCGNCNREKGFATGGGCNDLICAGSVCAVDPYCCEQSWDSVCVIRASEICGCPPQKSYSGGASRIYAFTGESATFVVPTSAAFLNMFSCGGRGAYVEADTVNEGGSAWIFGFPVTPGESFTVAVGGPGTASAGGYNGGGEPGTAGCSSASGGGGGGATVFSREDGTTILVAGGGGGYGGPSVAGCGPGSGGGGGAGYYGGGGGGGVDGLGGSGGSLFLAGVGGGGDMTNSSGADGSFLMGGTGGDAPEDEALVEEFPGSAGGAGNGFPGQDSTLGQLTGGGGGGGSSFILPGTTGLLGICSFVDNGYLSITFFPPDNTPGQRRQRRETMSYRKIEGTKTMGADDTMKDYIYDWICVDSEITQCETMTPDNPECAKWCMRQARDFST